MAKKPDSLVADLLGDFRSAKVRRRVEASNGLTLHGFMMSEDFARPFFRSRGIEPSPVVQAIAQAAGGEPVTTIDEETCKAIFGCGPDGLPTEHRFTIVVGAGRGGGKTSNLVAVAAVHAMWTAELPNLASEEVAQAAVVCPELAEAKAAFGYVCSICRQSPVLSAHISEENTERIELTRPDGRKVEFVAIAPKPGGRGLRSKSLIFVAFDEGSFHAGDGQALSLNDQMSAAIGSATGRELKAQFWIVSSPWVEAEGPMEQIISEDHGKHSKAIVACRVSTYMLKGKPDDGSMRAAYRSDDEYRREILAIPLPKGTRQFFSTVLLQQACAKRPPAVTPAERGAGIDTGHIRDASAVATAARYLPTKDTRLPCFAIDGLREILSSRDQAPSATYRAMLTLLVERQVKRYASDAANKANLREASDAEGIQFVDAPEYVAPFIAARELLQEGLLALGSLDKATQASLVEQLEKVKAVERTDRPGHIKIILPRTKGGGAGGGGGSHVDSAVAFVLALWMVGSSDRSRWGAVVDRHRGVQPAMPDATRRGPGHIGSENQRALHGAPPARRVGAGYVGQRWGHGRAPGLRR